MGRVNKLLPLASSAWNGYGRGDLAAEHLEKLAELKKLFAIEGTQ